MDSAGNLYFADKMNRRIREVDTQGIITTVAGGGAAGHLGDGGAATSASLFVPVGVAFDAAGNMFIADFGYSIIRKVDTHGIITTVAGTVTGGAIPGDGGAATNAMLGSPDCLAVDAFGSLYIAVEGYNSIRKVDTNDIITTVAGDCSFGVCSGDGGPATLAGLSLPEGVTFDGAGNLYIADTDNNRVREVNLAGYPTVALTNVSATNAGSYTVVISSLYGSVTSAVATLTVNIPTTAPQIVADDGCFGFVANHFGFNLSGAFGQTVVVDGSADLVNWTPLCTNTVGSGPLYFYDPCWTNSPWRFYRARLP